MKSTYLGSKNLVSMDFAGAALMVVGGNQNDESVQWTVFEKR